MISTPATNLVRVRTKRETPAGGNDRPPGGYDDERTGDSRQELLEAHGNYFSKIHFLQDTSQPPRQKPHVNPSLTLAQILSSRG